MYKITSTVEKLRKNAQEFILITLLKLITVDETGIDKLEEEENNLVFMGYFVISTLEGGFPCWHVFVFVVCFKSTALEIWKILGGKSCERVLENVFSRCDYPVVDI